MKSKNTTVALLVACLMLISIVPLTIPVEAAPTPPRILEGYVYYGPSDMYPVDGDGTFRATSTTEVVQENFIHLADQGYIQFVLPDADVDDLYTVHAEQGMMGFIVEDTITKTIDDDVTSFADEDGPDDIPGNADDPSPHENLHLVHAGDDAWVAPFSSTGSLGPARYGTSPHVDVTPWTNPVLLEDGPGVYGCLAPAEPDVQGTFFRMAWETVDDIGVFTISDFRVYRWDNSLGKYSPMFMTNSGSFVTDGYISVLTPMAGQPICFGVGDVGNLNTLPVAIINASTNNPEPDEVVTFDCLQSVDFQDNTGDDGVIDSCTWDFGDGDTAVGMTVTHAYDEEGTFTVTLTVEDNDNTEDTDTKDIYVAEGVVDEDEDDDTLLEQNLAALMTETGKLCMFLGFIILIILFVMWKNRQG